MDDVSGLNFNHANRVRPAKVVSRTVTAWRPADDSNKNQQGLVYVECRMAEVEELDAYDGVLRMYPVIEHRFYDDKKKKTDPDIATTPIAPELMLDQHDNQGRLVRSGLKTRFASVLAEYETYLLREGRDLPLNMLGDVMYADLILMLRTFGITTAQAFVAMDDEALKAVGAALVKDGNGALAPRVKDFQRRTEDRLRTGGFIKTEKTKTPKAA
jgi:hypothetical protein